MLNVIRGSFCLGLLICLAACGEADIKTSEQSMAAPIVWTHPQDSSESFTVGPGADGGLSVVDSTGTVVGQFGAGDVKDIDLRDGVVVTTDNGNPGTASGLVIVAAANASAKSIDVAALNPDNGSLSSILEEPIPSNFDEPIVLCMYKSVADGNAYVFAADADGTLSQWLLYDSGLGTLRHTIMRTWSVGEPAVGCEADDEAGSMHVTVAGGVVWRYGAEPKDSFSQRERIN